MIYLLEDDNSIRELIVYTLNNQGFAAKGFYNAKDFYKAVEEQVPKLAFLDIMLPGEDGLSVLKRLRSDPKTKRLPVIMLTAKGTEFDKVIGLDSGADDYIAKPFGMMELISRMKAVLRRSEPEESSTEYKLSGLNVNVERHMVTVNGEEVLLTLKEFELLCLLFKNKGIVLSRDRILESVWGYDFDGETRTVDVHIRSMRIKLKECGELIETVRGIGYRIGGAG